MLLPPFLLTILALLRTTATFVPCNGNFCPPSIPKPKISPFETSGLAPVFLGTDKGSGCLCREYPNVYVVCFGRYFCRRMPMELNITTPVLKLTGTHITELRPGDFDITPQLEALNIDGNYNLTKILPGTFDSNLTKLTNISISFNPKLKMLYPHSFDGLVNLQALYLVKNGFEDVYDVTQSLSPLILPSLMKLSLNENNFKNISSDDFSPMENSTLEELNLILCRLDHLDSDCFAPLQNLKVLRLGENSFNESIITEVVAKTVEAGVPLRLLNLYSVGFRKSPPRRLMEVIAKSNITDLTLARNQFEVISKDMFPHVMPNLQVLDLKEVLALEIESEAFYNLPNLKTLLLSGNKLQNFPADATRSNITYLDLQQNSGNLFSPSYFSLKSSRFANLTHLAYLNLNFNRLNVICNKTFKGLENLIVLGLKNSTLYHIQNNSFVSLRNLWFLNLENNYFFINNYPGGIDVDVFKGLENLRVLLLGGCGITYFSKYGNPFVHLKKLQHLGLQRNQMVTIAPTEFVPLVRLTTIDISENKLTTWQRRIFSQNTKLKTVIVNRNKLSLLSEAMLDDFVNLTQLELEGNPFSCDCESYYVLNDWIHSSKDKAINVSMINARCVFPEQAQNFSLLEYFQSVQDGAMVCNPKRISKLVVVLPLLLLLLIFIALATVTYYYRWYIRYWIFLTRLYLSRKGKLKPRSEKKCYNNYIYDAFVSYSNEDRNFVVRLVSMLENYEPFIKLCVYDRDFQVGAMISESVLESVAKSRKTLLIISDNYAKSQWCRWESQIAEHHRLFFEDHNGEYVDDTLVLIRLGPVSANHLTPTLRYLLKTRIYLQWEVEEKKQKVFWEKLRGALTPHKKEEVVLENTRM
ncbi:hypothetical protein NQ315_016009 [Exocentrus adspersus]|uniref:TIR domain-containing protein n=1 Tax=Exocentrus adspersus TaxID=1586481 RepID=A0AAV8VLF4_9CUCU|nr:hypothetical protein NQ315_016009 [Exocentrus adspersus]